MPTTVADLQVKYSADTTGAKRGASETEGIIRSLTTGIKGVGIVAAGDLASQGIQRALGSVSGLVGVGLDFNAQMANVNSIAQMSTAELNKLSDSVVQISGDPRILAGPAELAAGLDQI